MIEFLDRPEKDPLRIAPVIALGLNHEQQHQELILTDVKHLLATNPLRPVYRQGLATDGTVNATPLAWVHFDGGLRWVGHEGDAFAYDNESPRHREYVEAFQLASRLVNCEEFLAFLDAGGYDRPELWLSDGWNARCIHGWRAPLYWEQGGNAWQIMTLGGLRPLDLAEPVCHVSYYEADAYARWVGVRMPTEAEWEAAAAGLPVTGNLLDSGHLHPAAPASSGMTQLFGDVWEWTASPYTPYPGYRPAAGVLGEYNGKFMCNQMVLRGGSCATPRSHIRATYRNFFPPEARWQFSGLRLARDEGTR
jgi:ergothioneine biosynthesis protein EgtB